MKIFLLIAGLFIGTEIFAGDVPAAVKAAFRNDYPHADVSLWEQTKEGCIATFRDEEGLKNAIYTQEGEWVETRIRIILRDIPYDVQKAIRKVTGVTRVTYIGKVQRPDGKFYRIESESAEAVTLRLFDENGEMISEEAFYFSTSKA